MAIIMVAWLLSNCGKRHDTLSVDSMTGIGMDRHELMDRQLAAGMQQNPDSVLGVIDSFQAGGHSRPGPAQTALRARDQALGTCPII